MSYIKITNDALKWTNPGHNVAVFDLGIAFGLYPDFLAATSSDGGNLRVYYWDGSQEIAVARQVINLSLFAQTGIIYFDSSHSQALTANEWRIYAEDGATEPAATDPLGSEAVWSHESAVYQHGVLEDAAGNNPAPINNGTTVGSGLIGDSFYLNGASDINVGLLGSFGSNKKKSFSYLLKSEEVSTDVQRVYSSNDGNQLFYQELNTSGAVLDMHQNSSENLYSYWIAGSPGEYTDATWKLLNFYKDEVTGEAKLFVNGAEVTISNSVSSSTNPYDFISGGEMIIGSNGSSLYFVYGDLNYIRLGHNTITPEYAETEYNNVSNTTTFWTVTEETGGGSTPTASGGSTSSISIAPESSGTSLKSSGSESLISIALEGSGSNTSTPTASGGSTSSISVAPEGTWTSFKSSGSESNIGIAPEGSGNPVTAGGGGSGTQSDPYLVSTPQDLHDVRNDLTAYYKQTADIDVTYDTQDPAGLFYNSGAGFEPLTGFAGGYDGNQKKIVGLYMNRGNDTGLFGKTNGCYVHDLGIEQADVTVGAYSGIFVGWTTVAGDMFERCYAKGKITFPGDVSWAAAGGFVGFAQAGTIQNCYTDVEVQAPDYTGNRIGGFCGRGSIQNYNYHTGLVNVPSGGGLTGEATAPNTCVWDMDTSGKTTSGGGEGMTTAQMKDINTFSTRNWQILDESSHDGELTTAPWFIDSGNGYPKLWFEYGGTSAPSFSGGSTILLNIAPESLGIKKAYAGTESNITISPEGEGVPTIFKSGFAEATVSISSEGEGFKEARGPPAEASVAITPEGFGSNTTSVEANGGYFPITNDALLWTNNAHDNAVFSLSHASVPQGFWDNVSSNGGNIRVYFWNGTSEIQVAREIVDFDSITKEGLIFFDSSNSVASTANEWRIYAEDGALEPGAASLYGSQSVWSSYGGVWHMGEGVLKDSAGKVPDSTSNTGTITAAGKLGSATDYNGSQNSIIPHAASIGPDVSNTLTYTAWISGDTWTRSLEKGDSYFLLNFGGSGDQGPLVKNGGGNVAASVGTLSFGVYHYLGGRYNGAAGTLDAILNGNINDTTTGLADTLDNSPLDLYLGSDDSGTNFDGRMEEVRVSSNVFSNDHLKTEYNNQNDSTTFWTAGAWVGAAGEESYSAGATSSIEVSPEGTGSKTLSEGSISTVNIISEGSGQKSSSDGNSTSVGIASEGSGFKKTLDSSEGLVTISSEGSGGQSSLEGSVSLIGVASEGGGQKTISNSTTSSISIVPESLGNKNISSGSEGILSIAPEGGGIQDLDASDWSVIWEFSTSNIQIASGGTTSNVGVSVGGSGQKVLEGGSSSSINIAPEGLGVKETSNDSESSVNIGPESIGSKTISQGNASAVSITTEEEGLRAAQGGAQAEVVTSPEGEGVKKVQSSAQTSTGITSEGAGESLRIGSADSATTITTESSGLKESLQGSESTISTAPEGSGEGLLLDAGGSTAPIGVSPEGEGRKITQGSAESTIQTAPEGAGRLEAFDGSTPSVNISSEGAGNKSTEGFNETSIEITTEGEGSGASQGGTTAVIGVGAESLGQKTTSGESTSSITTTPEGSGVAKALGGSETTAQISSTGEGFKETLSGTESTVSITPEGDGIGALINAGGRVSRVDVAPEGASSKSTSGRSEASISTTTESVGQKRPSEGNEDSINIYSEGSGEALFIGSSQAEVPVYAEGSATKSTDGSSDTLLDVTPEGLGTAVRSSEGGTTEISIEGEAEGTKSSVGANQGEVDIYSEGTAIASRKGSAQSDISITSEGKADKKAFGSNTYEVEVSPEGLGYTLRIGEGEDTIATRVSSEGSGLKKALNSSESLSQTDALGEGTKETEGSSTQLLSIIPTGEGNKWTAGSAQAPISIEGQGRGIIVLSGSSTASITTSSEGLGDKRAIGASEEKVNVSPESLALKKSLLGSETLTTIESSGTGNKEALGASATALYISSEVTGQKVAIGSASYELTIDSLAIGSKKTTGASTKSIEILTASAGIKEALSDGNSSVIVITLPEGLGEANLNIEILTAEGTISLKGDPLRGAHVALVQSENEDLSNPIIINKSKSISDGTYSMQWVKNIFNYYFVSVYYKDPSGKVYRETSLDFDVDLKERKKPDTLSTPIRSEEWLKKNRSSEEEESIQVESTPLLSEKELEGERTLIEGTFTLDGAPTPGAQVRVVHALKESFTQPKYSTSATTDANGYYYLRVDLKNSNYYYVEITYNEVEQLSEIKRVES